MTDPTQPSKGLSTGQKLLIGCLGVMVVAGVLATVAVAVGGFALKRQVDRFMGGMEEQQVASETMERLATEHPFEVPEDGVVSEDQLQAFVAATNRAWEDMRPWAEDLAELETREPGQRTGVGDMARAAGAVSGFARARVELAEALDEVGMSVGEYLWTGISLMRAMEVVEGDAAEGSVPEQNVRLAEARRDDLPAFESEEGRPGPGLVLAVATTWGMANPEVWQAYGLDTLEVR